MNTKAVVNVAADGSYSISFGDLTDAAAFVSGLVPKVRGTTVALEDAAGKVDGRSFLRKGKKSRSKHAWTEDELKVLLSIQKQTFSEVGKNPILRARHTEGSVYSYWNYLQRGRTPCKKRFPHLYKNDAMIRETVTNASDNFVHRGVSGSPTAFRV